MSSRIEDLFPSDSCILSCLKAQYRIDAPTLSPLPFSADPHASVYQAGPYFVKVKRGFEPDLSVEVAEILSSLPEIVSPILTTKGKAYERLEHCVVIVYPFIKGKNGFSIPLTDLQWIQFGKALRKIHEMQIPHSLQGKLRKETFSSQWRKAVREVPFYKEKKEVIEKLIDRAEKIVQHLSAADFVFCHSDIHAGNLLIGEEGKIYLIDWDDPMMAPKERDLMFIGGGVGGVWNQKREGSLFYEGYGQCKVDPHLLSYYRCERILEDIVLFSKEPGNDSLLLSMFEPGNVVDRALKNDPAPRHPL